MAKFPVLVSIFSDHEPLSLMVLTGCTIAADNTIRIRTGHFEWTLFGALDLALNGIHKAVIGIFTLLQRHILDTFLARRHFLLTGKEGGRWGCMRSDLANQFRLLPHLRIMAWIRMVHVLGILLAQHYFYMSMRDGILFIHLYRPRQCCRARRSALNGVAQRTQSECVQAKAFFSRRINLTLHHSIYLFFLIFFIFNIILWPLLWRLRWMR